MNNRTEGYALIIAIGALSTVALLSTAVLTRNQTQIRATGDGVALHQATAGARSAANVARAYMSAQLRDDLSNEVLLTANPTARWSYGSGTGNTPDEGTVNTGLANLKTRVQQAANAICDQNLNVGKSTVKVRIHFTPTACDQALPSRASLPPARFVDGNPRATFGGVALQTFAMPYVLVADATLGSSKRTVTIQGEYQFQVGRASFARYGLFTHRHTTLSGSRVNFTTDTLFDGPVHTNDRFTFYTGRPYFGSYVTSVGCTDTTAYPGSCNTRSPGAFFNTGSGNTAVNATSATSGLSSGSYCRNYGYCPEFTRSFDLNATYIAMPSNATDQKAAAALGGISLTGNRNMSLWVGNTGAAAGQASGEYQFIQSCPSGQTNWHSSCTTWRSRVVGGITVVQRYLLPANGAASSNSPAGWSAETPFNGVVYSEGNIERLSGPARSNRADGNTANPAVAEFSNLNLTVADNPLTTPVEGNVTVTGDLKYQDPPCTGQLRRVSASIQTATCENTTAKNLLGVYTQSGQIRIGSDWSGTCTGTSTSCTVGNILDHAPNNLNMHGVFMAASNEITVENYTVGPNRGALNLLGGLVQYYYGAFGLVGTNNGYNRAFTYDPRLLDGAAPPSFPTILADEVKAVFVRDYGASEQ